MLVVKKLKNFFWNFEKFQQTICNNYCRRPILDWWESSRFEQFVWLEVDSAKAALSHPTHQYTEGA
jgi:hypothetical protein